MRVTFICSETVVNCLTCSRLSLRWTLLAGILFPFLSYATTATADDTSGSVLTRPTIARNLNALPLSFEINQGQTDPQVKFFTRATDVFASFRHNEADLYLSRRQPAVVSEPNVPDGRDFFRDLLRMRLIGARDDSTISGEERRLGTVNYFIGNNPATWHTKIPTFERVKYTGVYAGTDLVYYGSGERLEFDFRLGPEADPTAIRIRFEGATHLRVDNGGNLVVVAPGGQVRFHKPDVYQIKADGHRDIIQGDFVISTGNTIGFRVGRYDRTRLLVIDPIFDYSTYIGPSAVAYAVAVDRTGEAVVTGVASHGFPTTAGSFQPDLKNQAYDAWGLFVIKFNSTATDLIYCTYLSGSGTDQAVAIAVDGNGNAVVGGQTGSKDFPVTPGAIQTVNRVSTGSPTGFVSMLNSSGTELIYSTYLGGTSGAGVYGVALDAYGNAYVTGTTADPDFPVTKGAFQTSNHSTLADSGYISKLNATGTQLVYSTYLGGSKMDVPLAIALDSSGIAYVGGETTSSDFPVTPGSFQTTYKATASELTTGFVSALKADGSGLKWSSYLGGSFLDYVSAIAVEAKAAYT